MGKYDGGPFRLERTGGKEWTCTHVLILTLSKGPPVGTSGEKTTLGLKITCGEHDNPFIGTVSSRFEVRRPKKRRPREEDGAGGVKRK